MKKSLFFLTIGLFGLAFPTIGHAVQVCFTDDTVTENFYVLNISPGCTKSTKTAAVHGKVFFGNPEVNCPQPAPGTGTIGRVWPVDGACFGVTPQDKIVLGFRVTSEGQGCVSRSTLLSGASLTSSLGLAGTTRPDGSTNSAITLTPTSCSNAPTQ
jgi:hypothetical protein